MSWWSAYTNLQNHASDILKLGHFKIVTCNLCLLEKSLDSFRRDKNCKEVNWNSHAPFAMRYLISLTAVTTTKCISARISDSDHRCYPLVHMRYKLSFIDLEFMVIFKGFFEAL